MAGLRNEYAYALGADLLNATPKNVLAAIAVSSLTCGGDQIAHAPELLLEEWTALHDAGIVPQKPPSRVEAGTVPEA